MNKKVITILLATAGVISLTSCRKKNPDLSSNVTKYEFPASGSVASDFFAVTSPVMKVAPGESRLLSLIHILLAMLTKG